jgi:hypothetical protein
MHRELVHAATQRCAIFDLTENVCGADLPFLELADPGLQFLGDLAIAPRARRAALAGARIAAQLEELLLGLDDPVDASRKLDGVKQPEVDGLGLVTLRFETCFQGAIVCSTGASARAAMIELAMMMPAVDSPRMTR